MEEIDTNPTENSRVTGTASSSSSPARAVEIHGNVMSDTSFVLLESDEANKIQNNIIMDEIIDTNPTENSMVTGTTASSSSSPAARAVDMTGNVTSNTSQQQQHYDGDVEEQEEDKKPAATNKAGCSSSTTSPPPTSVTSRLSDHDSESLHLAAYSASEQELESSERRQQHRERRQQRRRRVPEPSSGTSREAQYYNNNNNNNDSSSNLHPNNHPSTNENVESEALLHRGLQPIMGNGDSRVSSTRNLQEFRDHTVTTTTSRNPNEFRDTTTTTTTTSSSCPPSKTMPPPVIVAGSSSSNSQTPGAFMRRGNAFGDRPAWADRQPDNNNTGSSPPRNNNNEPRCGCEPLLEATLVIPEELTMLENNEEEEEGASADLFADEEAPNASVVSSSFFVVEPMEMEPCVLAEAAPIDHDRKNYHYLMAVYLLVIIFAVVLLAIVFSGQNDQSSNSSSIPPPNSLNETVATVPETICYERNPGAGKSTLCSVNDTLAQGGGVANLVAQSFLASFPNAALVISNAGLSRSDVAHGDFTGRDADVLLPYNNVMFLLQMKGSEIHFVMEQGLESMFSDPVHPLTGAYPYAAALKYAVNMTADFGNRLSDLQVKDRETGTWGMLDPSFVYTVAANSFIVEGGDGYLLFGEIEESEETTVGAMDAFLQYAWDQGVLLDPPLDDYSTISYISPAIKK